jgi:hypothetical protein
MWPQRRPRSGPSNGRSTIGPHLEAPLQFRARFGVGSVEAVAVIVVAVLASVAQVAARRQRRPHRVARAGPSASPAPESRRAANEVCTLDLGPTLHGSTPPRPWSTTAVASTAFRTPTPARRQVKMRPAERDQSSAGADTSSPVRPQGFIRSQLAGGCTVEYALRPELVAGHVGGGTSRVVARWPCRTARVSRHEATKATTRSSTRHPMTTRAAMAKRANAITASTSQGG